MKEKTILITGASAGIGEACARRFAAAGARLVLVARREDRLRRLEDALVAGGAGHVRSGKLDVRSRLAVEAFVRGLEEDGVEIDVLVNNAGLASGLGKLHEGDPEDWDRMIDTNIKGLLNVSRCVIPGMVERGRGHVVNIGSIAGRFVYPEGNVYCATKFAVHALNQGMSIDLVGTNVRVSSIDPGATETEFSEVRFHGDRRRAKEVYKGFQPLTGDDIADAVYYVVGTPAHVNIAEMVVMPTAQRSPFVLYRKGD